MNIFKRIANLFKSDKKNDAICANVVNNSERINSENRDSCQSETVVYDANVEQWPVDRLKAEADKGNPSAQYCLGGRYGRGEGVEMDVAQTVKLYKKAADAGLPNAQSDLGVLYAMGNGVSQDFKMALQWFRKAADGGFGEAMYNIGRCYLNGIEVEKSPDEAFRWFKRSADHDGVDGLVTVGKCYETGQLVAQDLDLAYSSYRKAAFLGSQEAYSLAKDLWERINGVMIVHTDEEAAIDEAQGKHQVNLPGKLRSETLKTKNRTETDNNASDNSTKDDFFSMIKKNAEHGNAYAQFLLGTCYLNGEGVSQDLDKATLWLKKAADQNMPEAMYNLAIIYGRYLNNDMLGRVMLIKASKLGFQPAVDLLERLNDDD